LLVKINGDKRLIPLAMIMFDYDYEYEYESRVTFYKDTAMAALLFVLPSTPPHSPAYP
jgi:hypothetical protein